MSETAKDMLKPPLEADMLKPPLEADMLKPPLEADMLKPPLEADMLKPPLEADMAIEHSNSDAMYKLGKLYQKQNKLDLAEKYYVIAAENNEKNQRLHSEFAMSEKYYLMAIEYGDEDASCLLGYLYEAHNKLDLAEKYYVMAVDKCSDADAMNNLGDIYSKQNKLYLAEKYYLLAIEHDNPTALKNVGYIYEDQNKFDLATKYYLKALLFDAGIIGYIINIISKTSHETQLETLELVPQIRATDEYFHKISRTAHYLYIDKKIEFTRTLSYYLIDNLANICLEYY